MRFKFGKNWKQYIKTINESKIEAAFISLSKSIGLTDLTNKSFIDIGCGSGLMSLVAQKMGASVFSFDYDKDSVEASKFIRDKFASSSNWQIERGSVLDCDYLNSLGKYDIVYSWGVLHHTGNMWQAFKNILSLTKQNGIIFIAIYNDQGFTSKFWKGVKYIYNSNVFGKLLVSAIFIPYFYLVGSIMRLIKYTNQSSEIKGYKKNRGMNIYHDIIDWIGGYPFEVAKPDEIFNFFSNKGYSLKYLKTTTSVGCNEYVFVKNNALYVD